MKSQLVCSEENMPDPFTKKLSNGPLEYLTSRYVHRELYFNFLLYKFQLNDIK